MLVYNINLLLILGLGWPLCVYKPSRIKKIIYLAITFSYMWFLNTFRFGIGFDYEAYIQIFENIRAASTPGELFAGWTTEVGFVLLTKLMTLFIHSPTVMYGVYAVLILAPVAWFIYRYCDDVWLSTWLFVTLTFFYTSMNFTRQSLACSIIVLGYRFLREKNLTSCLAFMGIALLAGTFHKTALIMIPIYFLCHIKLTKITGAAIAGVTVLSFLVSEPILRLVTNYIFSNYANSPWLKEGLPLLFLMIPVMVFGTCLAVKPTWERRHGHEATVLLNLMLYSLCVWLFITRHFILERLSMFMYIFVLVALPQAISCLKAAPEKIEARDKLAESLKKYKKQKPPVEETAKLKLLNNDISDHQKYYWSAAAAVLCMTALYNYFGANVNGFHNVFPYQSVLEWLNRIA